MSAPDPRAVPAAHSMDTAWFGVDQDGNLALFDTGEAGAFPEDAFGAYDYAHAVGEHDDAFAAICSALGMDEDDLWTGQVPVFRYHHDDENWIAGRYVRKFAPKRPSRIEEVPPELRPGIAKLQVRFVEGGPIQPVEHVPSVGWGATWLSSDGKVVRPFPGREADASEDRPDLSGTDIRYEPDPGPARTRGINAPEAPPREPARPRAQPRPLDPATASPDEMRAALGLPPRPAAPPAPEEAPAPSDPAPAPKKPWWKFW